MKKIIYIFVFSIVSLTKVFAQVDLKHEDTPEGSISVQPIENEFGLKAGQTKEIKIIINNRSNKKMQFNLYINDWNRDTLGEHHYSEPGTEPNSCSAWVTLDRKFVEVDTNEKQIVIVKMHVPDSTSAVKEMKWSMLFVESIEEAIAPENHTTVHAEVVPKMRWGIHLYQTPPTLSGKEFKLISLSHIQSDTSNIFRVICQNTGKLQARCKSYIELHSQTDDKKITLSAIEVPTFPGQKRYFDFKLPKDLAKGTYTVIGVIDGGADLDLEAAQTTLSIE